MKIVRYVVIFMLLSVYGYDISWAAFKDVTSETNEAAEEFSSEGMLGSFIYQFGQDMFRPDGYVTRESFILVLKEYHMLTKTILNQNKSFSERLSKLESRNLNKKDIDMILESIEDDIDDILAKSKTISKIINIASVSGMDEEGSPRAAKSLSRSDYKELEDEMENLSRRVEDIVSSGSFSPSNKQVKAITGEMNILRDKVKNLRKDVYLQNKEITDISNERREFLTELEKVNEDISSINEQIEGLSKSYMIGEASSGGKGGAISTDAEKKIKFISGELERINERITFLKKDVYMQKKEIVSFSNDENSMKNQIEDLKENIRDIEDQVEKSRLAGSSAAAAGSSDLKSSEVAVINKELNLLRDEVKYLREQLKEFRGQKAVVLKGSGDDSLSSAGSAALVKEFAAIKADINDLEETLERQRKYYQQSTMRDSVAGDGDSIFPFWAKISIGFSTVALFFMSR